jgi:transposase-like protein
VLAILAALFNGASRADAARRAGVGVSTFYVWLQLGRAGHPTFAPLAEAVANVEDARGLNVAYGHIIKRRSFWKAFPA